MDMREFKSTNLYEQILGQSNTADVDDEGPSFMPTARSQRATRLEYIADLAEQERIKKEKVSKRLEAKTQNFQRKRTLMEEVVSKSFVEMLSPLAYSETLVFTSLSMYCQSIIEFVPRLRTERKYFNQICTLISSPICVRLFGLLAHFCYWNILHPFARNSIVRCRDICDNPEALDQLLRDLLVPSKSRSRKRSDSDDIVTKLMNENEHESEIKMPLDREKAFQTLQDGLGAERKISTEGSLDSFGVMGDGGLAEDSNFTLNSDTSLAAAEKEVLFVQIEKCLMKIHSMMAFNKIALATSMQAYVTCCHFVVQEILSKSYRWLQIQEDGAENMTLLGGLAATESSARMKGRKSRKLEHSHKERFQLEVRELIHAALSDILDPSRVHAQSSVISAIVGYRWQQHDKQKFIYKPNVTSLATRAVFGDGGNAHIRRFLQQGVAVKREHLLHSHFPGVAEDCASIPCIPSLFTDPQNSIESIISGSHDDEVDFAYHAALSEIPVGVVKSLDGRTPLGRRTPPSRMSPLGSRSSSVISAPHPRTPTSRSSKQNSGNFIGFSNDSFEAPSSAGPLASCPEDAMMTEERGTFAESVANDAVASEEEVQRMDGISPRSNIIQRPFSSPDHAVERASDRINGDETLDCDAQKDFTDVEIDSAMHSRRNSRSMSASLNGRRSSIVTAAREKRFVNNINVIKGEIAKAKSWRSRPQTSDILNPRYNSRSLSDQDKLEKVAGSPDQCTDILNANPTKESIPPRTRESMRTSLPVVHNAAGLKRTRTTGSRPGTTRPGTTRPGTTRPGTADQNREVDFHKLFTKTNSGRTEAHFLAGLEYLSPTLQAQQSAPQSRQSRRPSSVFSRRSNLLSASADPFAAALAEIEESAEADEMGDRLPSTFDKRRSALGSRPDRSMVKNTAAKIELSLEGKSSLVNLLVKRTASHYNDRNIILHSRVPNARHRKNLLT
jgi:hypothetical protein